MQKLFKNTKNNHERMTLVGTVRGWQKVISQFSQKYFFFSFFGNGVDSLLLFPTVCDRKPRTKKSKIRFFFLSKWFTRFANKTISQNKLWNNRNKN